MANILFRLFFCILQKVDIKIENTTSPAEYGTVQLGFAENRGEPTNQNIKDTEVNSYNGFNQLIRTDIGYTTAEYAYRPDGFRMSKTVNKETTFHLWDGSNIVADLNSNMSVKDKYLRGINLIKNNSSYYIFNAHGDVVQLANGSGAVTKNYKYDAFGVETDINNTDINPFRYCGEYFDFETRNLYLRARVYNPTTSRMLSEDPHWNVKNMIYGDSWNTEYPAISLDAIRQSTNLYVYCMNNGVMFTDSSGLEVKESTVKLSPRYGSNNKLGVDSVTRVEFTNLNLIVYTIDGIHFNTDLSGLLNGEWLWVVDVDKIAGSGIHGGIRQTNEMSYLVAMDKAQGKNNILNFSKAGISLVSDIAMVFGLFGKMAGEAGATVVTVSNATGTGATAVSHTWSTSDNFSDLDEASRNLLKTLAGYAPIIGTGISFYDAITAAGYTVTLRK